ncbi:Uncharacterized protein GBIM_00076 [Gryllus bimaculatus]|nr:Uncharacterized protein GBIM_00076 [Gryllus bimaculatus]
MLKTPKIQIMDWPRGKSFSQRQLNSQKMSEPRMSTAICHLLLAGSSAWTCRTLHNAGQIQWAYGTLGLYFAKSVVGILRYGDAVDGNKYADTYDKVEFCSIALGPPLYAADLYLQYGSSQLLALFQAGLGCIPLFGNLNEHDALQDSLDLIVCGSLLATALTGIIHDNLHALWGSSWFYLNSYIIKKKEAIGGMQAVNVYVVGTSSINGRLENIYNKTYSVCRSLCMNFFLADLYHFSPLNHEIVQYMPIVHVVVGFLPLVTKALNRDSVIDAVANDTFCVVSGIGLGLASENYFAIAASALYGVIYLGDQLGDSFQFRDQIVEFVGLVAVELLMGSAITNSNWFHDFANKLH